MPHFTVVPVDGPRRGDYDNLEGLSWVDYGERADREDSDGEGAPRGVLGGGKGTGNPRTAHLQTPDVHTSMRAQLFLLCAAAPQPSFSQCVQPRFSWSPAPAIGPPSPPQLLPCGSQAGAADVADGGQANGAAWDAKSAEPPSLALSG